MVVVILGLSVGCCLGYFFQVVHESERSSVRQSALNPPSVMKPNPKVQRARLDERVKLFLQLLGELINARRVELNMSQATVAEMAGLSRTAVYNIEHGLVDERSTTLMRVAWALKMSHAGMVATLEHLMLHPEHRPQKRGLKTLRGKKAKGQL